jgi:hypothetical protein
MLHQEKSGNLGGNRFSGNTAKAEIASVATPRKPKSLQWQRLSNCSFCRVRFSGIASTWSASVKPNSVTGLGEFSPFEINNLKLIYATTICAHFFNASDKKYLLRSESWVIPRSFCHFPSISGHTESTFL